MVRERVCKARERQIERGGKPNSQLNNREIQRYCHLESADIHLFERRDRSPRVVGAIGAPDLEGGAHDCGSGGRRGDTVAASGRGDLLSAIGTGRPLTAARGNTHAERDRWYRT